MTDLKPTRRISATILIEQARDQLGIIVTREELSSPSFCLSLVERLYVLDMHNAAKRAFEELREPDNQCNIMTDFAPDKETK